MTSNRPFVFRENEAVAWFKDQRDLLASQRQEKDLMRACKKRLKVIDRAIFKNNEWLRKQ